MSPIAKGFLVLMALIATVVLSTQAFSETTRSHAGYDPSDAETLAEHLVTAQWVGYQDLFNQLEAEGKCIGVLIPVPTPVPPLFIKKSNDFEVRVFGLKTSDGTTVYGLLLGRYVRSSGT